MICRTKFFAIMMFLAFVGAFAQGRPSVTVHSVGLGSVSYVKNVELAVPAFDSTSFFFTGKWSADFDSLQTWKKMYTFDLKKEDVSVLFRTGNLGTFLTEEGFSLDSSKSAELLVKSALEQKVSLVKASDASFNVVKKIVYEKDLNAGYVEFVQNDKKGCFFMGLSATREVAFAQASMDKSAEDACLVLYKVWDRKEKIQTSKN